MSLVARVDEKLQVRLDPGVYRNPPLASFTLRLARDGSGQIQGFFL